jgi:hypothetical protein
MPSQTEDRTNNRSPPLNNYFSAVKRKAAPMGGLPFSYNFMSLEQETASFLMACMNDEITVKFLIIG